MTNYKIIFKGKDGSVAVMILAPDAEASEELKQDAIQKFKAAHDEGFYLDYIETKEPLPASRQFRDAWKLHQGKVIIDENKAKNIHLGRIRAARDKELDRLDMEQLRHLLDKDKLKAIEEKKQALRDIPQNFKGLDINKPEWPAGLPKGEY